MTQQDFDDADKYLKDVVLPFISNRANYSNLSCAEKWEQVFASFGDKQAVSQAIRSQTPWFPQ
eukprot:4937433-Lingulodinium_polyedra.AAC.1